MNSIQRRSFGIIVLTLVVSLASCAQSESGTPTTSTPDRSHTASPSTGMGDSAIQNPIDTTGLLDDPCQALDDENLASLSLVDGRIDDNTIDPTVNACVWERSEDSNSHADMTLVTENPNGLDDIRKQEQGSELFERAQIGAYPAVHASFEDRRDEGRCDLWVGVNDSEVLFIYVALHDVPDADDPCGYADQVGEKMVANLSS